MKYTKSDLLAMENPYELLIEQGESLLESREAIAALSSKEQIHLVTQIISGCPTEQFSKLNQKVHRSLVCSKFSESIGQACVLIKLLNSLKGEQPHLAFESREFNVSLFHKFPHLVSSVIPDMNAIEEKLVSTAPEEKLSSISRKLAELGSNTYGVKTSEDKSSQFRQLAETRREQTKLDTVSVGANRDGLFVNTSSQEQFTATTEEEKIEATFN
ncbi:hypothetical protein [Legionella brunensis]|uniref:Uncharacterized protein n=1 Tax=Legionella brunensis TaxID=29422 RepID=A0A0W0SPJ4_9GAMM|nr:hypothetical protein [Legionella brunensis]KTC84933.1 hypothetical protein Lbru_1148 [Legionella brunensis]